MVEFSQSKFEALRDLLADETGTLTIRNAAGKSLEIGNPERETLLKEVDRLVSPGASPARGLEWSTQQAADYFGVSRPTFIKLAETARLPVRLVGRHRRYNRADVIALADSAPDSRTFEYRQVQSDFEATGEYERELSRVLGAARESRS